MQAAYIIECKDLLIGELIHELGRSKQSDNASRQKVENQLRTTALESIRKDLTEKDESGKIDPHIIKKHANILIDEEILALGKVERTRKTVNCQKTLSYKSY
ncbi:MAG: hypothetical protein J5U17_07820 [Candidatus Methanoperedens sp.]|nr:hypothetical protein [Candidatus Methanoperedens sp.]MCE8429209.1 hypothetical protein [Candidatus Methanoperedens sp.]